MPFLISCLMMSTALTSKSSPNCFTVKAGGKLICFVDCVPSFVAWSSCCCSITVSRFLSVMLFSQLSSWHIPTTFGDFPDISWHAEHIPIALFLVLFPSILTWDKGTLPVLLFFLWD